MAEIITYIDDLDKAKGKETPGATKISFSYGENHYSIDLADPNATKFEKALEPFIEVATKIDAPSGRGATRVSPATGRRRTPNPDAPQLPEGVTTADAKKVLEELGYTDLPARGALRGELIDAYNNKTKAPKA